MVIQVRRKNNRKSGKTANTARSFSRRVPPKKLTAAVAARKDEDERSVHIGPEIRLPVPVLPRLVSPLRSSVSRPETDRVEGRPVQNTGREWKNKKMDAPHMLHASVTAQTGNRTQSRSTKTETRAAMSIGKMQYPRTQSDWKKDL